MNKPMLSQDLPENLNEFDIMPEDDDVNMDSDIMVDEGQPEEQEEAVEETIEETTEESTEGNEEEEELTLDDIFSEIEKQWEATEEVVEQAWDIKDSVEEIKEAADNWEDVVQLVNDLYEQVIEYETMTSTLQTKNDMLLEKLKDSNKKITEQEIKIAEMDSFSDPDMIALNRDYNEALASWSNSKVIKKLEEMYNKLSWKTFDQNYVDWLSGQWYSFNETTMPTYENNDVEEDIKDITSIF